MTTTTAAAATWQPTACILCECNCGIEIRLGDDGRTFDRIRGDKQHPASQGYTGEKALRLDRYQNGPHRLTSPMRRRPDGTYEEVDWDTAIREVAEGFTRVREAGGAAPVFYYGGGGQGNHLGGAYSAATSAALGIRYRSSALAQEKTGEAWVSGLMMGAYPRGDVEHAEVAVFVGKNPWQSHSIPHARPTLREIARDPARSIVVLDPRRTETAELADFHLALKPGTDAWCLTALCAVIVQEGLLAADWLAEHAAGLDAVVPVLQDVDIDRYAAICELDPDLLRRTARRIAKASSVALFEDLGVQMGLNSTLVSYLDRLLWMLTGNFAKEGAQYIPTSLQRILHAGYGGVQRRTPVTDAPVISGLIPSNSVADEILTDHPDRFRAMLVESSNPAHSLADSPRMRAAFEALEFSVVIDVAMTETAQLADYVLPAASQFEKAECTFFNFEFPHNVFHLRRPIVPAMEGTLPEPEIHARIIEALGLIDSELLAPLHEAAAGGRSAYGAAFTRLLTERRDLAALAPVLLYRTLGPTLPEGTASAAALWGLAHRVAEGIRPSLERAGITGEGPALAEALFDAIIDSPRGLTFSIDDPEDCWARVGTPDGRFHLDVEPMLEALAGLQHQEPPGNDPDFPLILSAGERRSFTANTIFRDPDWRRRDRDGALRLSPRDAERLGLTDGDEAVLTTGTGKTPVIVEINDGMRPGHISLPNGHGVSPVAGAPAVGVSPNDLTDTDHRDPFAGTPFHKHVPARLEPVHSA